MMEAKRIPITEETVRVIAEASTGSGMTKNSWQLASRMIVFDP